ncbi:MAG: phosphotransferase [Acidobacteriota bacterium]
MIGSPQKDSAAPADACAFEPGAVPDSVDPRLADFKVLLPLRGEATLLLRLPGARRYVAALERDGVEAVAARIDGGGTRFDVVVTDDAADAERVEAGGSLLLVGSSGVGVPPSFELVGKFLALPEWPGFRFLIPADGRYCRGALSDLRPVPAARVWSLAPLSFARRAAACLRLSRRGPAQPSLLARAGAALGVDLESGAGSPSVYSGRLGEGNPIVCFLPDTSGRLERVIKIARYPGVRQLAEEVGKIDEVLELAGPVAGRRVVAPAARGSVGERSVLLYDFERTDAFYGPFWRFGGRRRFLQAAGEWLAELARHSRTALGVEDHRATHVSPLKRLIDAERLPADLEPEARSARRSLLEAGAKKITVLEHGDLGIYNARLVDRSTGDFRVIDWGSSTSRGVALGDLVYLAVSAGCTAHLGVRIVSKYLRSLGLEELGRALWMSYVARRWEELDEVRGVDPANPESGGGALLEIARRGLSLVGG